MSLALVIYLINILSNLSIIAGAVFFLSLIILILLVLFGPLFLSDIDYMHDIVTNKVKKYGLRFLYYIYIPSLVLCILIPEKNDMYIMTGVIIGEKMIETNKGNEVLDKAYLALINKLEQASKEANEEESK